MSRGVRRRPRRLRNSASWSTSLHDGGAPPPRPGRHGFDARFGHRHPTLPAALAPDRDRAAAQVDVGRVELTDLGHPQAAPVEQLEDGVVAPADRLGIEVDRRRRVVEQARELVGPQHPGQPRLAFRRRQAARRVGRDGANARQPGEVAPHGRRRSGDGAAGVPPRGEVGEVAPEDEPVDGLGPGQTSALGPRDEAGEVASVGGDGGRAHRRER
jgi:hypothetical protein